MNKTNENPCPWGMYIPVVETVSKQDKYAAYQMVGNVREIKQVGGIRRGGMGSNFNRGVRKGLIEMVPFESRPEGGEG